MKVAAIFPVGTSDSGAPTAISEILKEESAIDVYLLFGKQGSADTPDPKDSVARIKQTVTGSRVTWAAEQEIEPHDFSETYSQIRAFISGLAEKRYDRVWVGITGGTNPMVTSLFQTAMAYLPCQVIPIYIQSKGVTLIRHFAASDVRDSVLAEDVLTTARSGQVRLAAKLAEKLPNEGRWKFLRSSLAGLAYWDDFDYLEAMEHLKMPARNAAAFSADKALAPLADTLTRIAADARQMADFTKDISAVDRFAGSVLKSGWEDKVYRYGILLVGDVLANAQRRIVEGRFTDSVLRSYRAAESATQMRLLAIGIHPSKPDACQLAFAKYQAHFIPTVKDLGFNAGLQLLNAIQQIHLAAFESDVRELSRTRNRTHLEHGYDRVIESAATRCFDFSLSICRHLLGAPIGEAWPRFTMRF